MKSAAFLPMSLAFVLALVAGCAGSDNLLGGRQECWSKAEPRMATLMRGTLELDLDGSTLATPEGDRMPLAFGGVTVQSDASGTLAIVDSNGRTVATDGDDVTVFAGMGSDGLLLVCGVEERHGP